MRTRNHHLRHKDFLNYNFSELVDWPLLFFCWRPPMLAGLLWSAFIFFYLMVGADIECNLDTDVPKIGLIMSRDCSYIRV